MPVSVDGHGQSLRARTKPATEISLCKKDVTKSSATSQLPGGASSEGALGRFPKHQGGRPPLSCYHLLPEASEGAHCTVSRLTVLFQGVDM